LKPELIKFYVARGEAFLQICDFQSAILNHKKACILDPDNDELYSRLAFIYFFQGQCLFDQKLYTKALESFSRAAEMKPEVIGYHTRR
jgi:tetratricopeptide (TPR) repeat protein